MAGDRTGENRGDSEWLRPGSTVLSHASIELSRMSNIVTFKTGNITELRKLVLKKEAGKKS